MEDKQLLAQTSFKKDRHNEFIYGKENGYFFVLEKGSQIGLYRLKVNIKDLDTVTKITDDLRVKHPCLPFGCVRQSVADAEVSIDVNILRFESADDFSSLIEDLTQNFKNKNLVQYSSADGSSENLGIYLIGREAKIVSDQSFGFEKEVNKKVSKGQQENRFLGYLGALAGLIVSVVIRVLIHRYTSFSFYGLEALITVVLAIKGYEIKGGTPRRMDIIILFILALLMGPVTSYVDLVVAIIPAGVYPPLGVFIEFLLNYYPIAFSQDPLNTILEFMFIMIYAGSYVRNRLNAAQSGPVHKYAYRKLM